MANTTPLVLDNVVLPARQGAAAVRRVLSRQSGSVFEEGREGPALLRDGRSARSPRCPSWSRARLRTPCSPASRKDRALASACRSTRPAGAITKFLQREPLQPPLPGYLGVAARQRRRARPAASVAAADLARARFLRDGFLVGVSAGVAIWAWHEVPVLRTSAAGSTSAHCRPTRHRRPIRSMGSSILPAVLRSSRHSEHSALREVLAVRSQWDESTQKTLGTTRLLSNAIVPVCWRQLARLVTSVAEAWSASPSDNKLYTVTTAGLCTQLSPNDVDIDVRPVAVRDAAGDLVVAVAKRPQAIS